MGQRWLFRSTGCIRGVTVMFYGCNERPFTGFGSSRTSAMGTKRGLARKVPLESEM